MKITALAAVTALGWSAGASAAALHGYCTGCSDNGNITPTTQNPPTFGFWAASGPLTGAYYLDILLADDGGAAPSGTTFGISGAFSGTANLFSSTAWNSGNLDTYLGFGAQPNNPIGAFLPLTQAFDPSAVGYWVFQVSLGQATLTGTAQDGQPGNLTLGSALPAGSVIAAFLITDSGGVATANSGALIESGPPTSVPEPGILALMGTALALFMGRRLLTRRALPMMH